MCRSVFVRSDAWVVVDGIGTPRRSRRGTRSRPRRSEPPSRAAASARSVRGYQRTTAPSPASPPSQCRRHRTPYASAGSTAAKRSKHWYGELPSGTERRQPRSTPPDRERVVLMSSVGLGRCGVRETASRTPTPRTATAPLPVSGTSGAARSAPTLTKLRSGFLPSPNPPQSRAGVCSQRVYSATFRRPGSSSSPALLGDARTVKTPQSSAA